MPEESIGSETRVRSKRRLNFNSRVAQKNVNKDLLSNLAPS